MLPVLANFRALAQQFIQGDMPANVFKPPASSPVVLTQAAAWVQPVSRPTG